MARKFRFALTPVLDHRQRIEDEKKQTVALRQVAYDAALAELTRLNDEFRDNAAFLRERHRDLEIEDLRSNYAHLQFLDRVIDAQTRAVAERKAELDRARDALLAAAKDRKVVERLRERRKNAFVAEELRVEQNELDDGNARQHGRLRQTGGMT
jgi:flagellar protein FliJ